MPARFYCLLLVLSFLTACSQSGVPDATDTLNGIAALPGLASLDYLRGPSVVMDEEIELSSALIFHNAVCNIGSGSVEFTAPADDIAYAIYRYTPPASAPEGIIASGDDTLWLLGADYDPAIDRWVLAGQFVEGMAQIDFTEYGDCTSPGGYVYIAVVCPPGQTSECDALIALNDLPDPFNLEVTNPTGFQAIMLSWDGGLADSFEIYRSTLADDPAPYLVGTEDDTATGNIWMDMVPPDPSEPGSWLAANNMNGTPGDTTDDFPFIAPGITYYYYIKAIGGSFDGQDSDTGFALVPWGTRRTARRELPSSLDRVQVFADQLLPNAMTNEQAQWCAENLCGTQKIFKWQAAEFRQYNPDFVALGYHLGVGAGDIGNVCGGPTEGSGWDEDADWPYVDRHDDWFTTLTGSTQPGGRVLQQDWNWYFADPASPWQEYLADNLLQTLGENHFDGWFIDSCSEPWNTDPAQWWPDGETMFGWYTPRLNEMLKTVTTTAHAHPLSPYIIPNAGAYITTLSDIKYYGSSWACDGIMIENYGRWSPGNQFAKADWLLELDRVIDHEQHGLAVIMQAGIDVSNTDDRLFMLATYLLVRGEHTYINWLGEGEDSSIGQWYPEWDLESGVLPFGQPDTTVPDNMAALYDDGLYKRHFSAGWVLVNVDDIAATWDAGPWGMWEALSVSGGGNINTDGSINGTATWTVVTNEQTIQPGTALIVRDNGID